jgi:hypothetical protein
MIMRLSPRSVWLRISLLAALILVLLLLTGGKCGSDTTADYFRAQQQANLKADLRVPKERPNSTLVKLPHGSRFRGFQDSYPEMGEVVEPAQGTLQTTMFGVLTFDADFDNQPELVARVLAMSPSEAFIDESGDGVFQPESEIHLLYDGGPLDSNPTVVITDPKGGEMAPAGAYSTILFRKLLDEEVPGLLAFTAGITTYYDDPGGDPSASREERIIKSWQRGAQVLPHVPFGTAGDLFLNSQIVINNPNSQESEVSIRFLDADTGLALPVPIGRNTQTTHRLTVPARSSRLVELAPGDNLLDIAFALVKGYPAVEASVNYVTRPVEPPVAFNPPSPTGEIIAEAGIAAAPTHTEHILNVVHDPRLGVSTAFAVANPTDGTAVMTITLLRARADGTDEEIGDAELRLLPRRQEAKFFLQLFEGIDLGGEEFRGTLVFSSNADIAITSLKTVNLMQSSSLPAGTFTLGRSR